MFLLSKQETRISKPVWHKRHSEVLIAPLQWDRRARGFALVIALSFVAFLLLLTLSLSLFLVVEKERSAATLRVDKARSHALLGLNAALGDIQRLLGPDQRATANASLLDMAHPDKAHWLGVWASDGSGHLGWLVSGNEDPDEAMANPAWVVGRGSASIMVAVPKVPVTENSVTTGAYAYWVSDSSQKARMDLIDSRLTASGYDFEHKSSLNETQVFGLNTLPGMTPLAAALVPDEAGNRLRAHIDRLANPGDLLLIEDSLRDALHEYFHDLTTLSYGLQTNVVDGGMKTDLTLALDSSSTLLEGTIYPGGPPWQLLKDFIELGNALQSGSAHPQPRNPTTQQGTQTQASGSLGYPDRHGLSPILLFWEVGIEVVPSPPSIYEDADPIPLHMQVEPVIVMANPYDVPLAESDYTFSITSGGGTYDPANRVVSRYPRFELNFVAPNGTLIKQLSHSNGTFVYGNYINEWLPGFAGHGSSTSTIYARNALRFGITTAFEPGEIKVFSLDSTQIIPGAADHYRIPLAHGEPRGHIARSHDISATLADSFTGADYDKYNHATASQRHFLRLRLPTGTLVGNLYIGSVDTDHSPSSINLTSTQRVRMLQPARGSQVYFGASLKGPYDLINSERNPTSLYGSKTLAHYNIRSHYQSTLLPAAPLSGDYRGTPTYSPRTDVQSSYNGLFTLWDPALFDNDYGEPRMVLFHVPKDAIFSIGELQHADLSFSAYYPTYAIGNSLASPWIANNQTIHPATGIQDLSYFLNETLWDRYYFSTLADGDNQEVLPRNKRFMLMEHAPNSELEDARLNASWILTRGPFNVNSTSVEAWVALLSGLRQFPVRYKDAFDDRENIHITDAAAFGRIPFPSGGPVKRSAAGPNRADDTDSSYWRGFRDLSDDQIRNLATNIVEEIRKRGPFYKLSSFINRDPFSDDMESRLKGALQAAIDATSINPPETPQNAILSPPPTTADSAGYSMAYQTPEALVGLRSAMAPGYLTQADILTQLGPVLTTRGDTFLVRSYGESINPLSGRIEAVARCEAIVQRLPNYLIDDTQGTEAPANAANQEFGRGFKLVAFRWLNSSEF